MGKSLDGIKKINDSLGRTRRVVLSAIGEKDPATIEDSAINEDKKTGAKKALYPNSRRVDGLMSFKNSGKMAAFIRSTEEKAGIKIKKELDKDEMPEPNENDESDKMKKAEKDEIEKLRKREEELRIKEEKKNKMLAEKIEAEKRKEDIKKMKAEDEHRRREEERLLRLKQEKEEQRKKEKEEEDRRMKKIIEEERKERARLEKEEASRLEQKRIMEESKRRLREKEKNKEKRRCAREERRKRLKESLLKASHALGNFAWNLISKGRKAAGIVKNTASAGIRQWPIILALFGVYLVCYLALAATLLLFDIDNEKTRKIGGFFPSVPALLSKDWAVDYFLYADTAKKGVCGNYPVKDYFIEKIIMDDLYRRYNLPKYGIEEKEPKEKAKELFISDRDYNKVGLARIKKIHELVEKEGDKFGEIGGKYGDQYFNDQLDGEKLKYARLENETSSGKISAVINGEDGYYIFKLSKMGEYGQAEAEVIFVKAKTLDEYLADQKNNTRVIKLVRDENNF